MHLRLPTLHRTFLFIFTVLLSVCAITTNYATVFAQVGGVAPGETLQTNPKPRETQVSAFVPDNGPPTTPILIAPENNSVIRVSKPYLVWKAATDPGGISKYDVYVDGVILFPAVPTYSVDTNLYTLIYDPVTMYYTLMPKYVINDGTHTWKVVAFDNLENTSTSVTWTFTIDTTAPYLILTDIGATPVSVSSQDISTVPTTPIVVSSTNPLLKGVGEALANVDLIVRFENSTQTQSYFFSIDENGTWELQLSNMPTNTIIYLDFVITDALGNISMLKNVPFIIRFDYDPVPQPSPDAQPSFPNIPVPLDPFEPLPLPPIIEELIPVLPPIIQQATEKTLLDNMFVPIFITVLLVLKLLLTVWPLQSSISFAWIKSGLKLLFFLPFVSKSKRVLVFDHATGVPVPFAPVSFSRHENTRIKLETVGFTDRHGLIYWLPSKDTWSVSVDQPTCTFPTILTESKPLSIFELYKGELLTFSDVEYPFLFIPVDRAPEITYSLREELLLRLRLVDGKTFVFYFTVCLFVSLFFPSFINLFSLCMYIITILLFYVSKKRSLTQISSFTNDKIAIPFSITKAKIPESNTIIDFDVSDTSGNSYLDISLENYYLDSYKFGWQLQSSKPPVIVMSPSK